MRMPFWLAMAAFVAAIAWVTWHVRRKAAERRRAEEERAAAFMMDFAGAQKTPMQTTPASTAARLPAMPSAAMPPANTGDIALQKLLFEAAHKAGEAGEPALAIQLYARLLARFPATSFAEPARAAVATLNKKVAKR